jgi:archaellum component FlaC
VTDDIPVTPGTGPDVATDDVGGRHFQIIKFDLGGDGLSVPVVDEMPVSMAAAPLPADAATETTLATLATEATLATVETDLDTVISGIATLIGHVDGVEALIGTTNTTLTAIDGHVDGIEGLIGTTNSTLTTIDGRVDGVETLLTAIDGHVDGLEAAVATTNSTLTTIDGHVDQIEGFVDGLEGLITTGNASLVTIDGHVDGIEASLTTIDGHVDGIETLIGTTNSTLTTIDGRVDGLEGKLDTVNTNLTTIDGHVDGIEGSVDGIETLLGTGATGLGKVEDAQHTTGDVGVMALGVRSAAPSERSAGPTDGDYEPFATNDVGAMWTSDAASANGGASTMNATSGDGSTALTNSAQVISANPGSLYGYYIYNANTVVEYVCFYNTAAASVTVGTTNPLFILAIPPASAANLFGAPGILFSTAMSWAASSTAATSVAPTVALDAVAWYK